TPINVKGVNHQEHEGSRRKTVLPSSGEPQALDRFRGHALDVLARGLDAYCRLQIARSSRRIHAAEWTLHLLLLTTTEQFFHRSVQEDSWKSRLFEEGGVVRLCERATSNCYYPWGRAQFLDQRAQSRMLNLAECSLSRLLENLLNRSALPNLDT